MEQIKVKRVKLTEEQKLENRRKYQRERQKLRYNEDPDYKLKKLNNARTYNEENKELKKIRDKEYYQKTKEFRQDEIKHQNEKAKIKRIQMKEEYEELKKKLNEIQKIL